jgi:uncharacterized membrane protein
MACAFHSDREGVSVCVTCGKELCEECRNEVEGKIYCAEHAEEASKVSGAGAQVPPPPPSSEAPKEVSGKSSTGLEPNIAALISYVFGWVTGLVFILLEQKDKYVRFHAFQSLYFFGGLFVIQASGIPILTAIFSRVPVFGWMLSLLFWSLGVLVGIVGFIFWILGMVKAYQGEWYKFPLVGEVAYKAVEKS